MPRLSQPAEQRSGAPPGGSTLGSKTGFAMSKPSVKSNRSAAVTGAGSGLGRDIALGLAAKNYRVFGTARSPDETVDLEVASNGAVVLTVCDITDGAQCVSA